MSGSTTWRAWACVLAIGLAACGGGGGGGGGSGGSAPPTVAAALQFTPEKLVAEFDPGVSVPLSVTARPTFATSGTVYVIVVDNSGVINPTLNLVAQPDGSYLAQLSTAALPTGRYTGQLEVRVCPVATCVQQFAGSPVMLPYDFTVGTPTNLTPLARIAGIGDWVTHQGNAAHDGYVPVSVNASRFTTRWRWLSADSDMGASPPVVANDTVYVATSGFFALSSKLIGLREADASVRWSYNFGGVFALNPPAVDGGAVYAATTGHSDTAMWSFDALTGAQRFRTPFQSQWEHYYAPTVLGGVVHTNGGYYGGLNTFDAATGEARWFAGLAQFDQWTPAVDASHAYANVGGKLSVLRRADGSVAAEMDLPGYSWGGWSSHVIPVLAGNARVLARSGGPFNANGQSSTLTLASPLSVPQIAWSVNGAFVTDPVVARGVVYVANASPLQLEARSLATGQIQWTWPLPSAQDTGFFGNLVVTDSHVFVSSNRKTYAVDLAGRNTAWTYGRPGHKAISANGILYITTLKADGSSDGGLTAVNLR